jgi:hypothetical protein
VATISLSGNTYTLIALPATPAPSAISMAMTDTVAVVESPFVPAQAQTMIWPAADRWSMDISLPKMRRSTAVAWIAFLAALQGLTNVFQIGDPLGKRPTGIAQGVPVVAAGSGLNAMGAVALTTRGWTANKYGQLLPGDYIQIGFRFHQITAQVNADASGNATLAIWPSLRETPADGTAISLVNPVGVFRLSSNKRQWHASPASLTELGFSCNEVV